jgi:sirohydrochlorin ferrochelatase
MKALIILAHGSPRQESNQEIKDLATEVKKISGKEYNLIEYAYLEMVEPTLLQSIDNVISKGVSDITVLPYFLNSGNHVTRDIPAMVDTAVENHPDCTFKISVCIGMLEDMPKLILEQARLD